MSEKSKFIVMDGRAMNDMDDAIVLGFAHSIQEARELALSNGDGVIYRNTLPQLTEDAFVEYVGPHDLAHN